MHHLLNNTPYSLLTELYTQKCFITHAALLRQGCPHCAKFPTAASRRSLDRVSVPVWPITLSGRLLIVALVGPYPTNQLIRRKPLFKRLVRRSQALMSTPKQHSCHAVLASLSASYPPLEGRSPTRYSPVCHCTLHPKVDFSFDLHVLSTPPAFILSQDQTLKLILYSASSRFNSHSRN